MSEVPRAALPELMAAAGDLGLELSTGQAEALLGHLSLLQRWNATYNLTAVRDPAAMLRQHLVDCLAMVPALRRHLASHPQARRLLDAGSGGGLPGVVLAVMLPQLAVTCVDTVGKKAAFVRQVAGTLGLPNLNAAHARVEALSDSPYDIVTSRAFASLADFVRLTEARLAPGGVWVAMKGLTPSDELQAVPAAVEVFHVEPLLVPGLDAQRCLVWMRKAKGA
jgi:16S rRNA (guanine527-N7)-methyltransferase